MDDNANQAVEAFKNGDKEPLATFILGRIENAFEEGYKLGMRHGRIDGIPYFLLGMGVGAVVLAVTQAVQHAH